MSFFGSVVECSKYSKLFDVEYLLFFVFWGLAMTGVSHFHEVMVLSDMGTGASVFYGWPYAYEARSYIIGCFDCPINLQFDYFFFGVDVFIWMFFSFAFLIFSGRILKKSYTLLMQPKHFRIIFALIFAGLTISANIFGFKYLPVPFSVLDSIAVGNMLWNYATAVNYIFFFLDISVYFVLWYTILTFIGYVLHLYRSMRSVAADGGQRKSEGQPSLKN